MASTSARSMDSRLASGLTRSASFSKQDKDTASAKIAEHITKFRRVRRAIVAHLDAGRSGVGPTARQVVEMLRTGCS
jgi:hypothetical protein